MCITVVLNVYVDEQVPVVLASKFVDIQDEFVSAKGTWVREGSLGDGSRARYPLNTSEIKCYKATYKCFEAKAYVGTLLSAEFVEYKIDSWTDTTIVFKDEYEYPCFTEIFTIDKITKSVNGVGRQLDTAKDECKAFPLAENETNWSYRLSDGVDVYLQLRKKVRPFPLRLIQTFFGN